MTHEHMRQTECGGHSTLEWQIRSMYIFHAKEVAPLPIVGYPAPVMQK